MLEIWLPVLGFEEYSISNLGRLRYEKPKRAPRSNDNINRIKREPYIVNQNLNKKGYPCVRIGLTNNRKSFSVHRLVAIAFIENPYNKTQVNHIDGNKQNNLVTNLEWVTNQENCIHTYASGITIRAIGEASPFAKLTDQQVRDIRKDPRENKQIALDYGVTPKYVGHIKARRSRKEVTP